MEESTHHAREGFSEADHNRFGELLERVQFVDGQTLVKEGEAAPGLLILRAGTVTVLKRDMGGEDQVITSLRAPALVGELELLTGDPCNATVVSDGHVLAHLLPTAVFEQLLANRDRAAVKLVRNLARALGRKLASTNEVLVDLAIWSVQ